VTGLPPVTHSWDVGVAFLAVVFALGLQVLRVLFPVVFEFFEDPSYARSAIVTVVIIGLGPLLAPIVRRGLGHRRAALVVVALLAAGRVALQLAGTIPLWLAAETTVFALMTLLVIVLGVGSPPSVAQGLLFGFALDVALQGAFRTWDPVWQEGALPLLVAVVSGVGAVILAWRTTFTDVTPVSPLGLIALGPFLFLHVIYFQDPALVASRSGTGLATAVAAILIVDAITIAALDALDRWRSILLVSVGLLGVIGLRVAAGPGILIPIALAACGSSAMLVMALRPESRPGALQAALGGAGGAVLFAILVIGYQKDRPLPFAAAYLLVAAAVVLLVLASAGWRRVSRDPIPRGRVFALGAIGLLAVPLGSWLASPATTTPSRSPGAVKIVDYNVHSAVNDDGQIVLETIARTIERHRPSVVVLQEVSRGWPVGGMTDVVGWLSWRLQMRALSIPSLDDRFATAILYRPTMQVEASGHGLLPSGRSPHPRSYLSVTFADVGREPLHVIATHLDADDDPRFRVAEIEVLLHAIDDPADTVVAGDLNAPLGSPELAMFRELGFASVQNLTGERDPTFPEEGETFDHILVGPGLTATDVVVDPSQTSDHRAIVATIRRL
jgi:endonuclease/exonuclease/phosphatase family metal-dependent hydrolase